MQSVSSSVHFPTTITTTPRAPLARSRYLYLFSLSFNFTLWSAKAAMAKSQLVLFFFFFCWLSLSLVVWLKFGDHFVSHNPIGVYASHSPGRILGCACTLCSYGQIPRGLPSPPTCVLSYTLSELICCIRLLYD